MELKKSQSISDFLQKTVFFSGISTELLIEICNESKVKNYYEKTPIFKKGDEGDAMYVILEGKVKIHENEHVFGYMTKGDCFGEYAIIDEESRSASVTVVEDSELLIIPSDHFLKLLSENIGFTQSIMSVLITRHRKLNITQEKLVASKQEIERINNKMSSLINGTMDAIIMFDEKFRIVLTNPSANSILENEDVLKRNILFFLDEDDATSLEKIVSGALKGNNKTNKHLPEPIEVIGSKDKAVVCEGTISNFKSGSIDYFILVLRSLEEKIEADRTIKALTKKTKYLEKELNELSNTHNIIASDASMNRVLDHIKQVAVTDATVLINGETGTGKELVAKAIHNASKRKDYIMVKINCGAIPTNLIESELFGHEKGAFTGAISNRKGRFLLADKGTIFLDEIGELPLDLQPKLLRVIQEGEFEPVGSSTTIKVNVRILAATYRDLKKLSEEGNFRRDLYYRLNVYPIHVPALKYRGDDVCLIAQKLINVFATKLNKTIIQLTESERILFKNYDWPGNVRELQNIVERAVILSRNGQVDWNKIIPNTPNETIPLPAENESRILLAKDIVELEKLNIIKALKKTKWKVFGKNGAAAMLQLPPTTLASKMKSLKIERPV